MRCVLEPFCWGEWGCDDDLIYKGVARGVEAWVCVVMVFWGVGGGGGRVLIQIHARVDMTASTAVVRPTTRSSVDVE